MSVKLMSQVWELANVDQGTLLVLLALADWANDKGVCWPSVPAIARKARLGDRQVRRILHALEERGIITVQEQRGRKRGKEYSTNVYRLNLTACPVLVELKPVSNGEVNLTAAVAKPDMSGGTIRKEPSVTATTREPSVSSRTIGVNSEGVVRQIAQAHPRHEKPVETERAIMEQVERLSRRMSFKDAADYLLRRTLLFARLTQDWPRDEFRKSFPASPRWFRSACFDENETNWEWHGNGNGTGKDELRRARNREAILQGIAGPRVGGDAGRNGQSVPAVAGAGRHQVVEADPDRAGAALRGADS